MSLENVKNYLLEKGFKRKIMEFPEKVISCDDAAKLVKCEPAQIAKTLAFQLKNGKVILVVTSGDMKIHNALFKMIFNERPKMIPAEQLEELTGHAIGCVCPFAIKDNTEVYLDISLNRYKYIYPGCGNGNNCIKVTPEELETYSQNCMGWADLCKKI